MNTLQKQIILITAILLSFTLSVVLLTEGVLILGVILYAVGVGLMALYVACYTDPRHLSHHPPYR